MFEMFDLELKILRWLADDKYEMYPVSSEQKMGSGNSRK